MYVDPAEAIIQAERDYGEVVNKANSYVWDSFHRKSKYRIETIGDTFIDVSSSGPDSDTEAYDTEIGLKIRMQLSCKIFCILLPTAF